MPSLRDRLRRGGPLAKSKRYWESGYDWSEGGEDWSVTWGDTDQLWWGALYPRIHPFLPTATVLEIAPGFGRCSRYLAMLSDRLILVDYAQRCIDACRERFRAYDHVEYHVNDGKSLMMIEPESVDFLFSFDSLVHAHRDVMEAYVRQLPRILRSDGVAFLHHSNLARYVRRPGRPRQDPIHGRDTTVSADGLRSFAASIGASCYAQELVPWGNDERYSDCFSMLTRPGSRWDREHRTLENPAFMNDARKLAALKDLYGAQTASA